MKKRYATFVLLFALIAVLSACSLLGSGEETPSEKKATSVSVVESTIPQNATIGLIDISQIHILITYSDGTTEEKTLDDSMLTSSSLAELEREGTHVLTVVYGNCTAKFQMRILSATVNTYKVTIYNGLPTYINGEKILKSVSLQNGCYEQLYEEGTSLTFSWVDDGSSFAYWTQNDMQVSQEGSIITVTVTEDSVFRPFTTAYVCTVSFNTFTSVDIESKQVALLGESDIAEIERENYVFIGWTTTVLTEEQALSGADFPLVSFPYAVGRDVTLYAVWKSNGLHFEKVGSHYEVTSFDGEFTELSVPASFRELPVTVIRKDAFDTPQGRLLRSVHLSKLLTEVQSGAFSVCPYLTEITVDKQSENLKDIDGVLYSKDETALIAYPCGKVTAVYTLPKNVEEIRERAFFDGIVGGIVLPEKLKEVKERAFESVHIDYVDFTSVNPALVKLGGSLFDDNITALCFAEGDVELYAETFTCLDGLEEKMITKQTALHKIYTYSYVEGDGQKITLLYRVTDDKDVIPADLSVKETAEIIGVTRTATTIALQIRFLPSEKEEYILTSIGYRAFNECKDLANVVFSYASRLERICDEAFADTLWIQSCTDKTIVANGVLYKYFGTASTVALSTNIQKIGCGAFQNNTALRYVNLGNGAMLSQFNAYAFYQCTSLKGFICEANPDGDGLYLKYAVTAIGDYAFYGTAISRCRLQESTAKQKNLLATIGKSAFENCKYMKSMELSATVTTIDNSSFAGTVSLEKFILPEQNAFFAVYDGILYRYSGEEYTLFAYPAARTDGEFNPARVKNYVNGYSTAFADTEEGKQGTSIAGSVVINGVSEILYITVTCNKDWKKVQNGDNYILTDNEDKELQPASEVGYDIDGNVDISNGDYYFYILSGSKKKVLLYDEDREEFYYYPTHRYEVGSPELNLAFYTEGTETELGTIKIGSTAYPVYLCVVSGKSIAVGQSASGQVPLDSETRNILTPTRKAVQRADGTVEADGEYFYYIYRDADKTRKTVLLLDSAKNSYYFMGDIFVTSMMKNALSYSNISAFCVPATMETIEEGAIVVPGLNYVRFERNPVSNYNAVFAEYEPDAVRFSLSINNASVLLFYQSDNDKKEAKTIYTDPYEYFYEYNSLTEKENKNILYARDTENDKVYVMRISRTVQHVAIPEKVVTKELGNITNTKNIASYAVMGVYLQSLELQAVGGLEDHAFYLAEGMEEIYVKCDFISEIGENVFGNKLNNGLYIFDEQNGINLYRESGWGLSFFTYKDEDGNTQTASPYLIVKKEPFAVVMYTNSQTGVTTTVSVLYGTITPEDATTIQQQIFVPGYIVVGWVREGEEEVIGTTADYTILYNQILSCKIEPQTYTIRFIVDGDCTVKDGEGKTLKEYAVTGVTRMYEGEVTFGAEYTFVLNGYKQESFLFTGWKTENGTVFDTESSWSTYLETGIITLYPVMEKKEYTLVYKIDTKEGESVSGSEKIVYFGEDYTLPIPTKAGKTFVGWYIMVGEEKIYITNEVGESLIHWNRSDATEYSVYAEWR